MAKGSLRIDLLGTSFAISADENISYLNGLLEKYRRVVDTAQRATGLQDALKVAIVSGILLCDELEKARSSGTPEDAEAERLALDLIARIDEALKDEPASP